MNNANILISLNLIYVLIFFNIISVIVFSIVLVRSGKNKFIIKKVDIGSNMFMCEDAYMNLLTVLDRVRARNKALGLHTSDYLHKSDVNWLDEVVRSVIKHEVNALNRG